MGSNRETELLSASLAKVQRIGKRLHCALMIVVAVSFVFVGVNLLALFACVGSGSLEIMQVGGFLYSLVQSVVMAIVCAFCASIAKDASCGKTPFADKQIRRAQYAARIMLIFTAMCFIWDPLVYEVALISGDMFVGLDSTTSASTFYINFGALVATGVLFLFAYILSYGQTLQQFSDETL